MKYSDLIDAVAAASGSSKADAKKSVETVFETIANTVGKKEEVVVAGFGTFSAKARAARSGRNPQTGAVVEIAASTAVGFKPAKALKDRVNA